MVFFWQFFRISFSFGPQSSKYFFLSLYPFLVGPPLLRDSAFGPADLVPSLWPPVPFFVGILQNFHKFFPLQARLVHTRALSSFYQDTVCPSCCLRKAFFRYPPNVCCGEPDHPTVEFLKFPCSVRLFLGSQPRRLLGQGFASSLSVAPRSFFLFLCF